MIIIGDVLLKDLWECSFTLPFTLNYIVIYLQKT